MSNKDWSLEKKYIHCNGIAYDQVTRYDVYIRQFIFIIEFCFTLTNLSNTFNIKHGKLECKTSGFKPYQLLLSSIFQSHSLPRIKLLRSNITV